MKWTTIRAKLGAGLAWLGEERADAHFPRESQQDGVACVATDYAFMGEKGRR